MGDFLSPRARFRSWLVGYIGGIRIDGSAMNMKSTEPISDQLAERIMRKLDEYGAEFK